jgi:lipid-A-disaccharide synthase
MMLREIKKIRPDLHAAAFGGNALKAAGADLILDMTKFSVVGLFEVVVKLVPFVRLIKRVFLWIKINRPRAVCLVDFPGFNLRLAKMMFDGKLSRKAGGDIAVIYYIPPQIWAWKRKRKNQMAKLVDSVATILPFEKDVFRGTSLDVSFVGHPFVAKNYAINVTHSPDGPILLLPGSRKSAARKIFPMLLGSFCEILEHSGEHLAVVVYPDEAILAVLRKILNKKFPELLDRVTFVADGENIEACATIMSSGTMSLRCCLSGIPGAIVYKTHPITYAVGKLLVRVKFLGIANILLNRCVWREFLQSQFRRKTIARYILSCINGTNVLRMFADASAELKEILSVGIDMPVGKWALSSLD